MSKEYEGQDPIAIAQQAERDLNSADAKQGHSNERSTVNTGKQNASDSTIDTGVDEAQASRFPGSEVKVGSAASGAGDNREIPLDEGGDINPVTGQPTKAKDFEGAGGPEDKARIAAETRGGDNDIRENIRQGGETVRPAGSLSNNAADGTGKRTN